MTQAVSIARLVRSAPRSSDRAIQPGEQDRQQQNAEEEKAKVHVVQNGLWFAEVPLNAAQGKRDRRGAQRLPRRAETRAAYGAFAS
jgi:hypothetical protein